MRRSAPPATLVLNVRTEVPSALAIVVATVEASDREKGTVAASVTPSPLGVTVVGCSPSTGSGVTSSGATVSIANVNDLDIALPARSFAPNVTVWPPSPSTTNEAVVSGCASPPSTATVFEPTPELASSNAGLTVTGPRNMPAVVPAAPSYATATVGGLVSIRKVIDFQVSRTPALSTARYWNSRTPFALSVATVSYE